MQELEALYPAIKREFEQLQGKGAFQPYRSPVPESDEEDGVKEKEGDGEVLPTPSEAPPQPSIDRDALGMLATDRGAWNVSYLHLHGMDFQENLQVREWCVLKSIPFL